MTIEHSQGYTTLIILELTLFWALLYFCSVPDRFFYNTTTFLPASQCYMIESVCLTSSDKPDSSELNSSDISADSLVSFISFQCCMTEGICLTDSDTADSSELNSSNINADLWLPFSLNGYMCHLFLLYLFMNLFMQLIFSWL